MRDPTTQDFQDLYADISACLLAFANALAEKGVLKKSDLIEAFQERLLALPNPAPHPFLLLKSFAVALNKSPDQ